MSEVEWHPYTLTSAPHHEYLEVAIDPTHILLESTDSLKVAIDPSPSFMCRSSSRTLATGATPFTSCTRDASPSPRTFVQQRCAPLLWCLCTACHALSFFRCFLGCCLAPQWRSRVLRYLNELWFGPLRPGSGLVLKPSARRRAAAAEPALHHDVPPSPFTDDSEVPYCTRSVVRFHSCTLSVVCPFDAGFAT